MNFRQHHSVTTLLVTIVLAVVLTTACAGNGSLTKTARLANFEKSSVVIKTKAGERHNFAIYLAMTSAQRKQGLSFITNLDANEGMLFIFPKSQHIRMWMKNTPTPLDMMFVDRNGTIVQIVHKTTPNSTESIRSQKNAYAVLELNAGTARRLGIGVGDILMHDYLN